MKTVNANPDWPLSPAQQEAWEQFETSDRNGQTLFNPWVDPQDAAPDCVVFFERIGRLVVQFMPGLYRLRDDQWLSQEATGAAVTVPDPLKETWCSANAVRDKLKLSTGCWRLCHTGAGVPRHGTRRGHPGRGTEEEGARALRGERSGQRFGRPSQ